MRFDALAILRDLRRDIIVDSAGWLIIAKAYEYLSLQAYKGEVTKAIWETYFDNMRSSTAFIFEEEQNHA